MSSAADAIEAAAYTALSAAVTLATVKQHVTEKTPPPLAIVGDIDLEPFNTKGADPDRRGELKIQCEMDEEARKPMLALQKQVEDALDGLTATPTGWRVQFAFIASTAGLSEDGAIYVGLSRFTVIALSN